MPFSDGDLLDLLHDTASAIDGALKGVADWGLAGTRDGQHHSDLAADDAALKVLAAADVGVLSEESGLHRADRDIVVVVDPLDGSTNASRGIPWYAVSLCAVDGDGARVGLVVDLPRGSRYQAVRGAGSSVDGCALHPSTCTSLDEAVVGLSGFPSFHLGWKQYRALGAVALDLCAVASGMLDAYIDCSDSAHHPWDYLAGMLICQEAGAVVGDAESRDLVTLEVGARRTPLAAGTPELFDQVVAKRALA
ncbi:MAG TPA: inositol monophosphatase [Acidimicrobiales bacterium]|jgi:fructose-1,6-bisphosphatase/inositol monophosphatase family enzyme